MAMILVVDNDDSVREVLVDMLLMLGHEACDAGSAAAALELVEKGQNFDLLLTDLFMPVMNGAELIAELRRRGCRQPMLVLTGYVATETVDGATAVLHKPVWLGQLESAIIDALAG